MAPRAAGVAAVGIGRSARPRPSGGAGEPSAGGSAQRAVAADLDRLRLVARPGRAPRRPSGPRRARSRARSSGLRRGRRRGAAASRRRRRTWSSWSCRSWSCRSGRAADGTYLPTNIVTIVFGSCWVLPGGSCEMTTPSKRLDVGVLRCHLDLEARRLQRRLRVGLGLAGDVGQRRRLRAVGDGEVDASSPSSPSRSRLGTWLTTIPAGWSLSTSVRATAKPAACSCCSAVE